MGALLALEVVRELERRGAAVLALIVSGCPAPHLRATRAKRAPRTDAELVDQLRSWGGTPAELLDDPEFMALALRPLRADLALCDRYRSRPGRVQAPLTALAGSDDGVAAVPEVEAWAGYSARWRGVHVVDGGHFFVHAPGRVVDLVASALTSG
jgi:surfactin synthase thioesterase subunit